MRAILGEGVQRPREDVLREAVRVFLRCRARPHVPIDAIPIAVIERGEGGCCCRAASTSAASSPPSLALSRSLSRGKTMMVCTTPLPILSYRSYPTALRARAATFSRRTITISVYQYERTGQMGQAHPRRQPEVGSLVLSDAPRRGLFGHRPSACFRGSPGLKSRMVRRDSVPLEQPGDRFQSSPRMKTVQIEGLDVLL